MATYKKLSEEEQEMMIDSRIVQAERQLFDAMLNRDIEVAAIKAGSQDEGTQKAQIDAYENQVKVAEARLKAAQALAKK